MNLQHMVLCEIRLTQKENALQSHSHMDSEEIDLTEGKSSRLVTSCW